MKKFFNVKTISLLLAVVLLVGGAIGGTLAWIIAQTNTVTNTFTYGDIDITLEETDTNLDEDDDPSTNKYEMIPGATIDKDPTVTVLADSEDCWLFVKLEKSANFDTFMTYAMADGWTELEAGVYYREVAAATADQAFAVIKDDTVSVKGEVTKEMLNALDATAGAETYPTLAVTAYAVQKTGFTTAAAAWTEASK